MSSNADRQARMWRAWSAGAPHTAFRRFDGTQPRELDREKKRELHVRISLPHGAEVTFEGDD